MVRPAALLVLAAALASCKNPQPCPEPLEECGGQCVDVQTDRRNCGRCGFACRAGEVCGRAACGPDVRAPCPVRTGGAFVTFATCGTGSVKVWVAEPDFVLEAPAYVGSTTPAKVPVLKVRSGSDCDEQWSWQIDDAVASFELPVTGTGCDVCPSVIQANVPGYVLAPGTWCPSYGHAQIVAVDPR